MRTVRLDLIGNDKVVLIVRKNNKPFKVIDKDVINRKVRGIWLFTGEEVKLDGGEATTSVGTEWSKSLIKELESNKEKIDNTIKIIKGLDH